MTNTPDTPNALLGAVTPDDETEEVAALRQAIANERATAVTHLADARAERDSLNAHIRHLVSSVELYDRLLRSFTKTRRTREVKRS